MQKDSLCFGRNFLRRLQQDILGRMRDAVPPRLTRMTHGTAPQDYVGHILKALGAGLDPRNYRSQDR